MTEFRYLDQIEEGIYFGIEVAESIKPLSDRELLATIYFFQKLRYAYFGI
jgi:hypothetical protein